jgi:hypothetical protein
MSHAKILSDTPLTPDPRFRDNANIPYSSPGRLQDTKMLNFFGKRGCK